VAAPETRGELATEVDDIICAVTAEPFYAVGVWYDDFAQTSDAEVRELLEQAGHQATSPPAGDRSG
jgi:predicted phosphoribosyltransferase